MEKATCTLSDMNVSRKMSPPLMTSWSLQQDRALFNLSRKMYIFKFYVVVGVKTTEMRFGPYKGELAAAEIPALIICDSPVVQHWLQT